MFRNQIGVYEYHFVDKTRFIRELEHYKVPALLRPRRFGTPPGFS